MYGLPVCWRYDCKDQLDFWRRAHWQMAESTLKKVEEELNCSICLDTYTNPKLLQCLHAYCHKCLVPLVERNLQGQLVLTCPMCRQDTPVPANGVADLQPAFQINHFLEIMEQHKKAAADPSASTETSLKSQSPYEKGKLCCREHNGKEVELYCETCGELICLRCGLKGGNHHLHEYVDLDKAVQSYKGEVVASLKPVEKQVTTITEALAQLEARCGEISDQRTAVEADLHTTFGKLQHILDARKTELIDQLHHITQKKLKELAVQKDQLETTLAQLNSCLGFMKNSLKTGSHEEVLSMKSAVFKRVKKLTIAFPPEMLKPISENDVTFTSHSDVAMVCQNFGQLSTLFSADPSKCQVTPIMEATAVGNTSAAVLQTSNFLGQPFEEPVQSIECKLVSEITGTSMQDCLQRTGMGQYQISYTPTIKGRHQLHIKIRGKHIRGSPFSLSAKSPIAKLGTPIQTLRGLMGPCGVAINRWGEVVVAEWGGHCVSVFRASGKKCLTFGTQGSLPRQFRNPHSVTMDDKGNILVTDCFNHRIQKFTPEGQFLAAVGTSGSGPLQFTYPTGIVFNAVNKKLYIADGNNGRVQVLNSDLTFSGFFGSAGSGRGQFNIPRGIACDSEGNVYVADRHNHRIQVFTSEGIFLRMFGKYGEGSGELKRPMAVAVGSDNVVYVSEWDNHRVSVFNSNGVYIKSFGSNGEGPGQFSVPSGIAVDNSGVVYVCDETNRIQLF